MSKEPVDLNSKTILITGAAGFIGSNLAMRLLDATEGSTIIGLDCLTDYNPVELKEWRLQQIEVSHTEDCYASLLSASITKYH